jgi:hypothetical protein
VAFSVASPTLPEPTSGKRSIKSVSIYRHNLSTL